MFREEPKPNAASELVTNPAAGTNQQSATGIDIDHADVHACLTEVETFIRAAWGSSIRLELRLGSNLPLVACDHPGLQNAILNLLFNARDAMPSGGLISIDAAAIAQGPATVVELRIQDSGIGMTQETRCFVPSIRFSPRRGPAWAVSVCRW